MKRLTLLLLLGGALCLPQLRAGVPFQELDLHEARRLASSTDRLFVLYFSADWCLPCQWMEQNTFADDALAAYVSAHYLAVRINVDESNQESLRLRFDVDKYPTMLLFSAAGIMLDRRESSLTATEMLTWLQTHDLPANHLHPEPPAAPQALAEDAPRPTVSFSRPALVPEGNQSGSLAQAPPPVITPTEARLKLSDETLVASAEPTFTPRTGRRYGVALGPDTYNYTEGVRAAAELESKLGRRADLLPMPDGRFRLVSGDFQDQREARRWLIFLNRNDLIGEVIPLRP